MYTAVFNNLKLSAKKYPFQDAIIFYGNKITYSELFLEVQKIAGYLKKELNLSNEALGSKTFLFVQK